MISRYSHPISISIDTDAVELALLITSLVEYLYSPYTIPSKNNILLPVPTGAIIMAAHGCTTSDTVRSANGHRLVYEQAMMFMIPL